MLEAEFKGALLKLSVVEDKCLECTIESSAISQMLMLISNCQEILNVSI